MLWAFLLEGRWRDGEDVMATVLNQCDIISGGLWSGLRLIFSLRHQSFHARSFLQPHPVTERHPHFPRRSRISSVSPVIPFEGPHLNGSGLTLTSRCCRRIYQCALSSIFYLPAHQGVRFPLLHSLLIALKNTGWILYLYDISFSASVFPLKLTWPPPHLRPPFTAGCTHLLPPRHKFSPPPFFKHCQWTVHIFFFFWVKPPLLPHFYFLPPPLFSPIHFKLCRAGVTVADVALPTNICCLRFCWIIIRWSD